MEKMLTEEQLNKLDKGALITIILSIANQIKQECVNVWQNNGALQSQHHAYLA